METTRRVTHRGCPLESKNLQVLLLCCCPLFVGSLALTCIDLQVPSTAAARERERGAAAVVYFFQQAFRAAPIAESVGI